MALNIGELEEWRASKPAFDSCIENTGDLEDTMLIPEDTNKKELDEIFDQKKTLGMYLNICIYIYCVAR